MARETPRALAIWVTVAPLESIAVAAASFSGVHTVGRPIGAPLVLAASRPAIVRSVMSSRSNSAKEAKMAKVKRPAAVVVSMASRRLRKKTPRAARSSTPDGKESDQDDQDAT